MNYEDFYISIHPNQNEEDLIKNIESLNYLLKSAGAKAEIVNKEEYGFKLLHVSCEMEDYSKKAKRHAGRPQIITRKMTVGEAQELRKTHTMEEIAKMAGISRRTLYRNLERYKNYKDMSL